MSFQRRCCCDDGGTPVEGACCNRPPPFTCCVNTLDQVGCQTTGGLWFADRQCLEDGVARDVPWACLDCQQLLDELFAIAGVGGSPDYNCIPVGSWGGEGRCRDGCKEIEISWSGFSVGVQDSTGGPGCPGPTCNINPTPACPCPGCTISGSATFSDLPLVEVPDDEVCCSLRAGGEDTAYNSWGDCVEKDPAGNPEVIWQCEPLPGSPDHPCRPQAVAYCTYPTADTPVTTPGDETCCQVGMGGGTAVFAKDLNDPQGSCSVIAGTYEFDSITDLGNVGNFLGWPDGGMPQQATPGTLAVTITA